MKTETLKVMLIVAIALVVGGLAILWKQPFQSLAGLAAGEALFSTSTPAVADLTNLCPAQVGYASSTVGVLGSVNITQVGTGGLTIYDATTSNATLRSADQATSSLILIDFPVTSTAGSYQLDIAFKRGLLIDYATNVSSSTITYRCNE